jgi:outer membrane protein assembly factor BamB/TolB-like protein
MKTLRHLLSLAICLLMSCAAFAASRPKTLAVVDFQNASGDRSLDSIGLGIMEEISTDLADVRGVTLIERRELNEVLKELKFDRSQYVDPSAAQKIGKVLGADYMVVGGYLKFQDDIRLTARLVEVGTAKVVLPAKAEGKYANLMGLQDQLAESLRKGIAGGFAEEESSPVAPSTTNLEAFQDFSDGLKFYRDELFADAAAKFDAAVKLDPRYSRAHFYRGLALEKQYHWEEAMQSFKSALLGAEGTNRQMWSWEVPYQKPGSQRAVGAINFRPAREERDLKEKAGENIGDMASFSEDARRFYFAEQVGKTTTLYFVDPFMRTFKQISLPDPDVAYGSVGTDEQSNTAMFTAFLQGVDWSSQTMKRYAVDPDEGVLRWNNTYKVNGGWIGWSMTDSSVYTYSSGGDFLAQDWTTGRARWKKALRTTRFGAWVVPDFGDVVAACTPKPGGWHYFRGSDGSELWTLSGNCDDLDWQDHGASLLILDAKAGLVTAYRSTSGQKLFEIAVPLQKVTMDNGSEHTVYFLRGDTLYVAGKDKTLYALAVDEKTHAANRVLWKAPVDVRRGIQAPRGHITTVTKSGYLVVINPTSGKIEHQVKVGDEILYLIYERGDLEINQVGDSRRIFAIDLKKGEKIWESNVWQDNTRAVYMEGMLLFQSGKREITALDANTGGVVWRHSGDKSPIAIPGKNSVLVADITGVKEYASPKVDPGTSLAEAEVVTELSRCLLQLNRPDEALAQAQRVVRELDPDYAEAHLALARIYGQRDDRQARRRELLAYYSLVDPKTSLAQLVLSDLKKNFGLAWQADAEQADRVDSDLAGRSLVLSGYSGLNSALDPESGAFLWHEKSDPTTWSDWHSPQQVFVVTRPPEQKTLQLWHVDPASGEKKMLSSLDVQEIPSMVNYAAGKRDILVWVSERNPSNEGQRWRLYSFDLASGKLLWKTQYDGKPEEFFFQAVPGESQVVYAAGNTLNAVAADSGKVLSQQTLPSQITGLAQRPGHPSEVYFTYGGLQIAVFDASTSKVTTTAGLPEGQYIRPLSQDFLHGSAFYFYAPHEIVAMDLGANTRQQDRILWRFPLAEAQRVEKIKVIGDYLYCLRDDDTLLRLEPETGKLLSENPVLWDLADFTVNGDVLYGLGSDSRVYAMKLAPLAGLR